MHLFIKACVVSLLMQTVYCEVLPNESGKMAERFFEDAHTDHEERDYVTRDDIEAVFLKAYDANRNGIVTRPEFLNRPVGADINPVLFDVSKCLWLEYDTNADGHLTGEDYDRMFDLIDQNPANDEASEAEFVSYFTMLIDRAMDDGKAHRC